MRDPFGILERCWPLTKAGPVRINLDRVPQFVKTLAREKYRAPRELFYFPDWTGEEKAALILIFNAINFSFWPDRGAPRWAVFTGGARLLDGSSAAFWCLETAARQGMVDILHFPRLANLKKDELRRIFLGREGVEIPLLEERQRCLRELGEGIPIRRPGDIQELLKSWNYNVVEAVNFLTSHVPNFNDFADLGEGYQVPFYKRVQLAVSMIQRALTVGPFLPGPFRDIDRLTAFADYRLPQILREEGVLEYQKNLAELVDEEEELPPNSVAEVCIRAATVWAVEYIRQELETLLQAQSEGVRITAARVDQLLWWRARERKDRMRPHHRTRTIAY